MHGLTDNRVTRAPFDGASGSSPPPAVALLRSVLGMPAAAERIAA